MGPDLTTKNWIVAKVLLLAILVLLAGSLQFTIDTAIWQEILLLLICVWASCRFHSFVFHVLHASVDAGLKNAGLLDLLGKLWQKSPLLRPPKKTPTGGADGRDS